MQYHNFTQLLQMAKEKKASIAQIILENEIENTEKTKEEIYAELANRWDVMKASAQKALDQPQKMPGGLIEGQAQKQFDFSTQKGGFSGGVINRLMAMALSSSEVNASMGRICAAPTAGSCGVLPAVLFVAAQEREIPDEQLMEPLLVAAGVGAIIMKNATVSGAEGGCQAECGAAAAMAAAAIICLAQGTNEMMAEAVSISIMNCMGLVCDPVAGLVQLPCSFRNASQAVNAFISADLAMAGQKAVIPTDEVVEAMYRVGKKLPMELRETALGGIAASPTAKKIQAKLKL